MKFKIETLIFAVIVSVISGIAVKVIYDKWIDGWDWLDK